MFSPKCSSTVVAVSMRVDHLADRRETRDSLDQNVMDLLSNIGFIGVPVPNAFHKERLLLFLDRIRPDGILLSGGNDIGQFTSRDSTELTLLEYAQASTLPVLGICRGMQVMAVHGGANLEKNEGHVATRHYIYENFNNSSKPIREVNSFHNFSVFHCPEDYIATSYSCDGSIESFKHKKLNWEGWMWHPERDSSISSIDASGILSLFSGES